MVSLEETKFKSEGERARGYGQLWGGKNYPIPSPTAPQNTENLSDTPKAPQIFFLEHFKIDLEMQIFRLLVACAYLLAVATGQNKLRISKLPCQTFPTSTIEI